MFTVLITIKENRIGHIEVSLVNKRLLRVFGYERSNNEADIYLQSEADIDTFFNDACLTASDKKWLNRGWNVRKKFGYDLIQDYLACYH